MNEQQIDFDQFPYLASSVGSKARKFESGGWKMI